MSVWLPPTTGEQPSVTLTRWAAFDVLIPELGSPTVHVVGFFSEAGEGRVTSPVSRLKGSQRACVTRSGRTYRLDGPPGLNSQALYVWRQWKATWKVEVRGDATDAMEALLNADAKAAGGEHLPLQAGAEPANDALAVLASHEWAALHRFGAMTLGRTAWSLFQHHGRILSGPHAGSYVSGVPCAAARSLVATLLGGEEVPVLLTHLARDCASVGTKFVGGQLVMLFADHTEPAAGACE
jgi:hypothetical protein